MDALYFSGYFGPEIWGEMTRCESALNVNMFTIELFLARTAVVGKPSKQQYLDRSGSILMEGLN